MNEKDTIITKTGGAKRFGMIFAAFALAIVAGCASVDPKGDQQTVYASAATVGTALIAANAYQSLPDCSVSPQPCSTAEVNTKLQAAKVRLLDAYKRADAVVNSPGYDASEVAKAQAILQAALDFLISLTPTP